MKDKDVLNLLIEIGAIISEMFGEDCEVAISQERKVVAIFNGHVTNRKVGSSIGPEANERVDNYADGSYVNYSKTNTNNPEYDLKASTYCLELDGKFTSFCINYDTSTMERTLKKFSDFLTINGSETEMKGVHTGIQKDFDEAVKAIGKSVKLMNKEDRLEVIKYLDKSGSFEYSKSIVTVAKLLGVTRHTIYNYLNELGISMSKSSEL
ncbi:MAG: transcriptional regulator [Tissierellia bacterium]|nr:transcriptional regulator [Tissierellia bacterium]